MKIQNLTPTGSINSDVLKLTIFKRRLPCAFIILIFSLLFLGCKKNSAEPGSSDYGYGKLTIQCEKQCHFESTSQSEKTAFDIDSSTAVVYFRYKANYDLNVTVTPAESTQTLTLQVYTKGEKIIFNNTTRKKAGEVWNNVILVP